MPNPKTPSKARKSDIREANTRQIIAAAEALFAEKGFNGTSTQEIADKAGLPKANVHYYFKTKQDLYAVLLKDILDAWMQDARFFQISDEPEEVLRQYIQAKMEHSFSRPKGSKVWAMEIIQGGPILGKEIKKALVTWDETVTQKIQSWIDRGKIYPVQPQSLLNMIWSSTQYYADYDYQVKALNGNKQLSAAQKKQAVEDVTRLILNGILK
ncbi:TetR/AcrR family transcriptional regulator [Aestuariicella sp. G3-2]|uniref:TetR/AcrR family transcriptional regulator n=1 Tax=Pseudomaricurvus albidus TaxID=2842452 RepID=UPI001C0B3400|nr:TetR/AcrR family transcriptional regulator [Aestuariicella albida]MBU3071378.1 TetR/AcrR family transcriptional regulator [Aestuariicella albida]